MFIPGDFMIFIVFQSLKDVDYVVKDKTLLENILDTEFLDASEKGIFYNGRLNVLMYF